MAKSTYLTSLNGRIIKDENAIADLSIVNTLLTITDGKGTSKTLNLPDTTYSAATQTENGLLSKDDKKKLDGIEVNANNYSLPTASTTVKGGIIVGSGLAVDNGKLNVSVSAYDVIGYEPATKDLATTTEPGLMSNADKVKLNGIATGANNYSLPTASSSVKGGVKVGSGLAINSDTLSVNLSAATKSASGLMSSSDKTKLDTIPSGAFTWGRLANK